MTDGHRGIGLKEQACHRFADNIGSSDDDGIQAREILAEALFDQEHASGRRTRHKGTLEATCREHADVLKMKAIDIFPGKYRLGYLLFVDMRGKRQLYEDAVHSWILVQLPDQPQDLFLARIGRQRMLYRVETTGLGSTLLVTNIHLAGRIFADNDYGKARLHASVFDEFGSPL